MPVLGQCNAEGVLLSTTDAMEPIDIHDSAISGVHDHEDRKIIDSGQIQATYVAALGDGISPLARGCLEVVRRIGASLQVRNGGAADGAGIMVIEGKGAKNPPTRIQGATRA